MYCSGSMSMENMSASNCQYVQILDLHQARPGSSQPTYLSQSGHPLLTGTLHLNHALGAAGQGQQLSLGLSPAELVRDGIIDCHPGDMTATRGKGKGKARRTAGPAKQQQMQQQQQQQPSYYPRPSPAHFMQSVGLSPAHPAALRAGPSRVGPTGRKRVVDRLIRPESEYDVFVPKKSLSCKEFNARIDCKGCGAEFPATFVSGTAIFGNPAFFYHCTKECPKYRDLQLIRKCDECSLLFINTQSERKHHGEAHQKKLRIKKPEWMSDQVYRVRSGIRCNTKVSCSACGLYFGAQNSAGKISYSLEYLIHCIQDCVEYAKLNIVQTCPVCSCKFLNRLSLSQHKLKSKH